MGSITGTRDKLILRKVVGALRPAVSRAREVVGRNMNSHTRKVASERMDWESRSDLESKNTVRNDPSLSELSKQAVGGQRGKAKVIACGSQKRWQSKQKAEEHEGDDAVVINIPNDRIASETTDLPCADDIKRCDAIKRPVININS